MLDKLIEPVLEFIKFEFRLAGQFRFDWAIVILVILLVFYLIKKRGKNNGN